MSAVAEREVAELLGQAEVAEALGVSRQRVGQLVAEGNAPEPEAILRGAPLWSPVQVAKWAAKRRGVGEPA